MRVFLESEGALQPSLASAGASRRAVMRSGDGLEFGCPPSPRSVVRTRTWRSAWHSTPEQRPVRVRSARGWLERAGAPTRVTGTGELLMVAANGEISLATSRKAVAAERQRACHSGGGRGVWAFACVAGSLA
jgi:hypothetical protein